MQSRRIRRSLAGVLSVALGSLALVGLQATAASASTSTVSVSYRCDTTMFGINYEELQTIPVRITTPSDVDAGASLSITYDLPGVTPHSVPVALTNVVLQATASATVEKHTGGTATAASGVGAVGSPQTIPAFGSFSPPMPVAIAAPTTGFVPGDRIDVRPASLVISVVSGDGGITGSSMTCSPETTAPVATWVGVANAIPASPIDHCTAQTGDTTGPPGCDTQQRLDAEVTAGTLKQAATTMAPNLSPTTVNFPDVQSPASTFSVTRPMNTVTVTDTRGGLFGWSLTSSLSNFDTPSGPGMPASAASITGLSCPGDASSAPSIASPGGSYATTQSLCQVAGGSVGPNQSSGGSFAVNGTLQLDVPAFQHAGSYSAILTITLA